MFCAHCKKEFHPSVKFFVLGQDDRGTWAVIAQNCPACKKFLANLSVGTPLRHQHSNSIMGIDNVVAHYPIVPLVQDAKQASSDVPAKYANDFNEANVVLPHSPKSAAALARRCLQHVLREEARTKAHDLFDQIDEVIASNQLPSSIVNALHAVRTIGNIAVHPLKSKSTGEIVEVEPGEAEWTIDSLEALFDFYFVMPAKTSARKTELNAKLVAAGKSPIP